MRRKFSDWVKVGRGRIETDSEGNQIAHVYTNAIMRGDTGYIRLTPRRKETAATHSPSAAAQAAAEEN